MEGGVVRDEKGLGDLGGVNSEGLNYIGLSNTICDALPQKVHKVFF